MKKRQWGAILLSLSMILSIVACGTSSGSSASESSKASDVGISIEPLVDDGSKTVLDIGDSLGPNGEKPEGVEAILNIISEEKKEEIRKAGYTMAVSLHNTNMDWSILQIQGIQAVCDEFNIELLTTTDAEMKVDKQVSDLESIIGLKPDILLSFVLDADTIAPVLKKATDQGIILSLIDTVPAGFTAPEDYAGIALGDNYMMGYSSADKLASYLDGKGKVAMMVYTSSLFMTDARTQGARDAFAKYPDIEIAAEQQVGGAEDAATAAENIITANPDIQGIWTFWDTPGMGAVAAVEAAGRQKDIKVATVDLSTDSAYSIASEDGALLCTGAQHPYDQAVAEALIGIAAKAGLEVPPYIVVPGEIVTKESMEKSWERVQKTPLPEDLANLLKQ